MLYGSFTSAIARSLAMDPVRALHKPGVLENRLVDGQRGPGRRPERLLREYAAVLEEAISSPIFPIRRGRPTAGTKTTAAGLMRTRICRS